jgi:hypothetical protein
VQTIKERLATMDDGHWLLIAAPTIEHMITGTSRVGVMKDGTVKVAYEDGTIEERRGNDALLGTMDADNPSLFALVDYVQDGRDPCIANAPALPPQRSGGRQEQVVGGTIQEDER